ncbi:hypothetical protein ACFLZ1_03960 [Patescibacteria group bacterium]
MLPDVNSYSNKGLPFYISSSGGFLQVIAGIVKKEKLNINSISFGKIPLDTFVQGEIKDIKMFGEMVGTLSKNSWPKPIDSSFCNFILPDKDVFTKFLQIPKVDKKEVENAISYQVKNFLPHKPEDMYVDWQLINNKGDLTEASVVAVNKKIIDSYLKALSLINVYPLCFKPESFMLAKLASLVSKDPSLVLYFTEQTATHCFVENSGVLFATTSKFSPLEKKDKDLLNDLSQSAKFWRSTFSKDREIKNIFIAGFVQDEPKINAVLKSEFNLSAKKLPLPVVLPRKINDSRLARLIPLFGAVYCQTFKDEQEKQLSLIPENVKFIRENYKFTKQVKTILTATIFIISGFIGIYLFIFLNTFFQLEKTKSSLSGLERIIYTASQSKLEKDAINLNERVIALDKILKKRKIISPYFVDLYAKIPAGIVVQEVNFNSEKKLFEIRGTASSRNDILGLEKSLSALGKVSIPLTSFQESQNPKFSANLVLGK